MTSGPITTDAMAHGADRGCAGRWIWLAVGASMFAWYALTTQRGPAWQDSGIFQWRILNFDLAGDMGLALAHPLLILLGKALSYLPLGSLAYRMNLVSAVCGAIACANVALLIRRLVPQRPAAAWVGAGFFGLAHTPWWLSTVCESQMVFAAVFTANLHVLVSMVRKPRPALVLLLGAVNGVALLAHNLALLSLAVYGLTVLVLCVRGKLRWVATPLLAAGWLVGASALVLMTVRLAGQVGPVAAVKSALFGRNWQSDVLGSSGWQAQLRAMRMGLGYILFNFPNAALILAPAGLWAMRKTSLRKLRWPIAGLAAIYLGFAIRYTVVDQFMFFGPFYAMLAILAGVGLGSLGERSYRWALPAAMFTVLIGPFAYAAMPAVSRLAGLPTPGRKDLPFRDPARYWYSPWKAREDSAGLFARAALEQVPAGSTIIADSTSLWPLRWVQRVEGIGANVELVQSLSREELFGRPNVFAVSARRGYYPAWLDESAELKKPPHGVLYRVVWHDRTAPGGKAAVGDESASGSAAGEAPGQVNR